MALRLGSSTPSKLYLGSVEVTKAYLGASEVYSTGGGAWTPADLGASLALWLDAEDTASITLNGSTVSQWADKSGNGRNATQATAASQPTYTAADAVLNGKPSVGSTTHLGLVGMVTPSLTAREWLMVTAYDNGTTALFPPGGSAYPTLLSGPDSFGAERAGMGQVSTANWFEATSIWADLPYRNGAATASTTALPMPASILRFSGASTVTQSWGIGFNQTTADRSWDGPIGEVIAVGATLSTANRQKLEGYLAHKWGLTANLPADHPYKSTPPTVTP
jgi:hypothetical protein